MEGTVLHKSIFKQYKKQFGKQKNVCQAPFTSIYFKPDGSMQPCCAYNPKFHFGFYPDTNIREAINSVSRKKLQGKIKVLDFSHGCLSCLKSLQSGNIRSSINSQYRHYEIGDYPKVLEFELSYFCNLDCIMCNLHNSIKENVIYDDEFVEEIIPYLQHAEAAKFLGGEPFVIPIYRKIWEVIRSENIDVQVHIQTNGTVLNEELLELIKDLNVYIGISIDGMQKQTYESIRKGANFEKVLSNIKEFHKLMLEHGKPLSFSYTPMSVNWQDIPEFVNFVNQYQGILYFNNLITPYNLSLSHLSVAKLKEIHALISESEYKYSNSCHFKPNMDALKDFLRGIQYLIKENLESEKLYTPLTLKNWLFVLEEKLEDKEDIDKLKKMIDDKYLNTILIPRIQNKFCGLEKSVVNNYIKLWIGKEEICEILNFLEIDI